MLRLIALPLLLLLSLAAQAQQYYVAPKIIGLRENGQQTTVHYSAASQQIVSQIEIAAVGQQYPGTSRYHTMAGSTVACDTPVAATTQNCWANIPSTLYTAMGGATTFGNCVSWTQGTLTGGTLYTTGTYTNVPLTGGTGQGARGTVTVSGGAVTAVTFTVMPPGYAASDSLTSANTNIGGTGSGFAVAISSVGTGVYGCTTSSPGTNNEVNAPNTDRVFWNPGLHKQVVVTLGDSIAKAMMSGCCGSGGNVGYAGVLMPVGVKTTQPNLSIAGQFWQKAIMTRSWAVPWSRLLYVVGDVGWDFSVRPGYINTDYASAGQWLQNTPIYQYLTFANNQQAVFVIQVGTNDYTTGTGTAAANSTLTCTSNVVTVTTASPHTVPNAQTFTAIIAGVTPSGYNGVYAATSTGASTFTYALTCPAAETVPGTYQSCLYGSVTQGWPNLAGYLQTLISTIKTNWPNANGGKGPYIVAMAPVARLPNGGSCTGGGANNQGFQDYAAYVAANMATVGVHVLIKFDNVGPLSPVNAATVVTNPDIYADVSTHPTTYAAQVYEWNYVKMALDRIQFGSSAVTLPSNIFTTNGV